MAISCARAGIRTTKYLDPCEFGVLEILQTSIKNLDYKLGLHQKLSVIQTALDSGCRVRKDCREPKLQQVQGIPLLDPGLKPQKPACVINQNKNVTCR